MLVIASIVLLMVILIPRLKSLTYITSTIVFLLSGVALYLLPIPWELPNLTDEPEVFKRITELGVIIALASAGLKINKPLQWKSWYISARLLIITMPLTIFFTAFLGWWAAGFVPASALLLGAVTAPTDPVLADDVQASYSKSTDSSTTKLALTTEAGLNDGLAFPFTNLAIATAVLGLNPTAWIQDWLLIDVLYKIILGGFIGLVSGRFLAYLLFNLSHNGAAEFAKEVFAVALILFPYSIAELASSYGFISVFVAACAFRQYESEHEYQDKVHLASVTMEKILEGVIMLLVGGYIVSGALAPLTMSMILIALVVIFIVRPVCAFIAFTGSGIPWYKRGVIAFFGIRGIGSLYYLSYGIYMADFMQVEELWAITFLIITISIFVHGIPAKSVMNALENRQ